MKIQATVLTVLMSVAALSMATAGCGANDDPIGEGTASASEELRSGRRRPDPTVRDAESPAPSGDAAASAATGCDLCEVARACSDAVNTSGGPPSTMSAAQCRTYADPSIYISICRLWLTSIRGAWIGAGRVPPEACR
jgi:hypothetical protein